MQAEVEQAVRSSVQIALDRAPAASDYVLAHSQEMDPDVCRAHIELYVNDFTLDYGAEGAEPSESSSTRPPLSASRRSHKGLFWDD